MQVAGVNSPSVWVPAAGSDAGWTGAKQGEVGIPTRSRWSLAVQMAVMLGVLALMILVNAVVVVQTQAIVADAHARALAAEHMASTDLRLQTAVRRQDEALLSYFATRDAIFVNDFEAAKQATDVEMRQLTPGRLDAVDRQNLVRLTADYNSWETWADHRRAIGPRTSAADAVDGLTGDLLMQSLNRSALTFEQRLRTEAEQADAFAGERSASLARTVQGTAVLSLLVLILLAAVFFRSTLQPVRQLVAAAIDLASGRRVAVPSTRRRDEIGQLAQALEAWNRSAQERLALARSMAEVSDQENLTDVLRLGAKRIQEELGAAQVVVHLGLRSRWRVVHSSPAQYAAELLLERSPEAEALRTRRVFGDDLRTGDWDNELRAWQTVNDLGPVLCIPLVSGRELLGVVTAVRRINQPAFSALDLELSELVVPPIATAIHVALLMTDNRRRRAVEAPTQVAPMTPAGY